MVQYTLHRQLLEQMQDVKNHSLHNHCGVTLAAQHAVTCAQHVRTYVQMHLDL